MPVYAGLLTYLAVVGAVWAAYLVRKHRRRVSKPHLEAAEAYEGNLVIVPPGHGQHARPIFRSSPGSEHISHGHPHTGHSGGHHAGGGHP